MCDEEILQVFLATHESVFLDSKTVKKLVRQLFKNNVLDDFIVLFTSLAEGYFDPNNITFLLCLERCHFESLKTTTQMRYKDTTKLFWKLLQSETSGKAMHFAGGLKSKGSITGHVSRHGSFAPKDSNTNFAVPSGHVLNLCSAMKCDMPSEIEPGLILDSIEMFPNETDVVLLADGKSLAWGQLPNGKGDVDLFGHEDAPTHLQLQKFLDDIVHAVDQLKRSVDSDNIWKVILQLSELMQSLRKKSNYFQCWQQSMKTRFQRENNQKSYSAGLSWVNGMDYKL